MKCAHCQAPKAGNRWRLQVCADRRIKRSKWLCDRCDVEINLLVLRFFGDQFANAKIARYTENDAAEGRGSGG